MKASTNRHDDGGLVEQLRSGDQGAFDQLMRTHGSAVHGYAWAVADSQEQVEDLVQDTFLVLRRRRRRVTLVGEFLLPRLLATYRLTAFNANRRRRRAAAVPLESVEHVVGGRGDPASRDHLRWAAGESAQLSERARRLVEPASFTAMPTEMSPANSVYRLPPRKRMQRVRERLRAAQLKEES